MVLVVDGVAVAAVSRVLFDVGVVVVNVTVPRFAAVVAVAGCVSNNFLNYHHLLQALSACWHHDIVVFRSLLPANKPPYVDYQMALHVPVDERGTADDLSEDAFPDALAVNASMFETTRLVLLVTESVARSGHLTEQPVWWQKKDGLVYPNLQQLVLKND